MPQTPSTRWCPTPEQLMLLEEMYRGGIRTPNSAQIQQIAAYLSYYGKIEGKNVFYWFQNHKARDRQKQRMRRVIPAATPLHILLQHHHNHFHSSSSPLLHHQPQTTLQVEIPHPSLQLQPFLQTPPHHHFLLQGGYRQATPAMPTNVLHAPQIYRREAHPMERLASTPISENSSSSNKGSAGDEWVVMIDVGGATPPCRPLKTLELFPTKSASVKEE